MLLAIDDVPVAEDGSIPFRDAERIGRRAQRAQWARSRGFELVDRTLYEYGILEEVPTPRPVGCSGAQIWSIFFDHPVGPRTEMPGTLFAGVGTFGPSKHFAKGHVLFEGGMCGVGDEGGALTVASIR